MGDPAEFDSSKSKGITFGRPSSLANNNQMSSGTVSNDTTTPKYSNPKFATVTFTEILKKARLAEADFATDRYETQKAKKKVEDEEKTKEQANRLNGARRREVEKKKAVKEAGFQLIEGVTQQIAAHVEAECREEIRERMRKDQHMWYDQYQDQKKREITAQLEINLEPLVEARLLKKMMPEVEESLRRDLKPSIIEDLKQEHEQKVIIELRREHERNAITFLRLQLKGQVLEDLRKQNTHLVIDQLRREHSDNVIRQLREEYAPTIMEELRRESKYKINNDTDDSRQKDTSASTNKSLEIDRAGRGNTTAADHGSTIYYPDVILGTSATDDSIGMPEEANSISENSDNTDETEHENILVTNNAFATTNYPTITSETSTTDESIDKHNDDIATSDETKEAKSENTAAAEEITPVHDPAVAHGTSAIDKSIEKHTGVTSISNTVNSTKYESVAVADKAKNHHDSATLKAKSVTNKSNEEHDIDPTAVVTASIAVDESSKKRDENTTSLLTPTDDNESVENNHKDVTVSVHGVLASNTADAVHDAAIAALESAKKWLEKCNSAHNDSAGKPDHTSCESVDEHNNTNNDSLHNLDSDTDSSIDEDDASQTSKDIALDPANHEIKFTDPPEKPHASRKRSFSEDEDQEGGFEQRDTKRLRREDYAADGDVGFEFPYDDEYDNESSGSEELFNKGDAKSRLANTHTTDDYVAFQDADDDELSGSEVEREDGVEEEEGEAGNKSEGYEEDESAQEGANATFNGRQQAIKTGFYSGGGYVEFGDIEVGFDEDFDENYEEQTTSINDVVARRVIRYTNTKDTAITLDDSDEEGEGDTTLVEDAGFVAVNKKRHAV
ncbi:MAG: hypothetical protein Q9164_000229 [Protoblastenia rupestris]